MRRYSEEAMDAFHTRSLLTEWKTEGLLREEQYERMGQETLSDLSTTHIFLRLVLFVFTVLCVAAAVGLIFVLLTPPRSMSTVIFFLVAALCYAATEFTVHETRFYRHGIEEALAVCSIGYLCAALSFVSTTPSTLLAAAALLSIWIWYRFDLWYTFLLAMVFVALLPPSTLSSTEHRLLVLALYAAALFVIVRIRPRDRLDALNQTYSLAEAFLWLGIFLTLNLKLDALDLPLPWIMGGLRGDTPSPYGSCFYWTTWLLLWCLPPLMLLRAVRLKDRFLLAAAIASAILTLVSNKAYLGWPRHSWDPMLLGILLTGVALSLRRWLAEGAFGVRKGFTATRPSKKELSWAGTGAAVVGLLSPHPLFPTSQQDGPEIPLGGGQSGGAGATRDF
jgi:hypothetical protein